MAEDLLRSDEYFKLDKAQKGRYLSKVKLLDGQDPYTLKDSDLTEDLSSLPPLR